MRKNTIPIHFNYLCFSLFLFCGFSLSYASDKPLDEVQIVIDVSGSMKYNDPNNLRIPAIKLLINLLPEGTKAGVWLFAEDTQRLVKTGIVNPQWKKNALLKIKKIHSRGLFTDIEEAVEISANRWLGKAAKGNRNLILLTDGVVDVSKEIEESEESRVRLLEELLPILQQAGVKIQTIALSGYADKPLLDKLALDTNGGSETAQTAKELQRLFLKIFQKTLPQEMLPIKDNIFSVDKSIDEFSVLIFKSANAERTQLITPDNQKIVSYKRGENISWVDEDNYDLITIKNPQAGDWKIVASMDPDNQVMIVTDLKLQMNPLENEFSNKETIPLEALFTNQDKPINRRDFLRLIDLSIEQTSPSGVVSQFKMLHQTKKRGTFSHILGTYSELGEYTIKIIADGKTFQREKIQRFKVKLMPVQVEMDINPQQRTVTLQLIADQSIDLNQMTVRAVINQIGQNVKEHLISNDNNQWQITLDIPKKGGRKIVNFSVTGKTTQGVTISENIKPVVIDDSLLPPPPIKEVIFQEPEEDKPEETQVVEKPIEESIVDTVEKTIEKTDWKVTTAIVAVSNLILFLFVFMAMKFMKKKKQNRYQHLLNRLDE